ncbi:MAG: DUF4158 domain-containing protein [Acidobacteriota bacterium]|nr:DUF4158 domain-containing protein [Acidobacteriota bacterium]
MTKSELRDFYTPILEEIFFVRETARNDDPQLHLLVQLKIFQRLGYFPDIEEIPETIVGHLRASLRLSKAVIPLVAPRNFAGETKVLDASELKDFNAPKRYALLVCLIRRAQIKTRDSIAQMFIRRIAKMHQSGKDELKKIQLKHLERSERLVAILSGVLQKVNLEQSDAKVGQNLKTILGGQDIPALLEDCELLSAFHGNNYFPLLWRFYRSHRSALFRLITALEFKSTSRDDSMQKALEFLIANENRRSDHLEAAVDLSFAEEKWREIVLKTVDGEPLYDRKIFEVCVFSHLAQELKSGNIVVVGSEEYGNYRDGLLNWTECESLAGEYCAEVYLPANAVDFVARLKAELSTVADAVD